MLKSSFEATDAEAVSPINVAAALIEMPDGTAYTRQFFNEDDLEEIARHLLTYTERVRARQIKAEREAMYNGYPGGR